MKNEIEELIEEMNKDEDEKEEKSIVVPTPIGKELIDVEEVDSIANGLVDMVKDDRTKADKIFDLFYGNLGLGQDRSTASKEAITKALELKIEASKNIIELLKIKTKTGDGTNVGLFFGGSVSPKKAGIDMDEIRNVSED